MSIEGNSSNAEPAPRQGCRAASGLACGCLSGLLAGLVIGAVAGVWLWIEYGEAAALDPNADFNLPEAPLSLDETVPYVDRLANGYLASGENVGLVVALIEAGDSRILGYGHVVQGDAAQPDGQTVFELASVGKTFTSTVLADMHRRGELSWDDPLEKYLPEGVAVPERNGRTITLLDLATQTSGLPSMPPNFRFGDPLNPYADYTVEEMYDGLSQTELAAAPGDHYEYSNFGFGLLGHALERRSGKTFEALVIERLCDPLGMDSTRMTLSETLRTRLATPHDGGEPVKIWEDTTMPGAGSFLSTAEDMVRYVQAHWSAEAGDLQRPRLGVASDTTRKWRPADIPSRSMGLGWHIDSENALDIIWHNGGAGGSCSYVAFLHEPRVGVVVLSNSSNPVDELGYRALYLLARH